jgi:hypothetical protein
MDFASREFAMCHLFIEEEPVDNCGAKATAGDELDDDDGVPSNASYNFSHVQTSFHRLVIHKFRARNNTSTGGFGEPYVVNGAEKIIVGTFVDVERSGCC